MGRDPNHHGDDYENADPRWDTSTSARNDADESGYKSGRTPKDKEQQDVVP
ncbi:MAG TPA: hypothetical protein VFE47_28185 [Tepidisphaeraceae bacterium]|jgi:hypothetical protein|nr:hypothetical protein [Tepidisphaeraceae bacterium]